MPALAPAAELRRAAALVVTFDGGKWSVTNFLKKSSFTCNATCLELLAKSSAWRTVDRYASELGRYTPASVRSNLETLVKAGGLVVKGSADAKDDQAYATRWEWGPGAGLFHFGSRNPKFMTRGEAEAYLEGRAKKRPSPATYQKNVSKSAIALPAVTSPDDVLSAMLRRRSVRAFRPTPVRAEQLGEALLSGLGILGFFQHPSLGTMPVTLTPSGGARNPFEVYVHCRKVEDVPEGIYHYSALQHSLERVPAQPVPRPSQMLPEQVWVDDAAAIVLLVANFDRTMWKYGEPFGYKTVLIEAGHIAQNIAVTCAKLGLTANPTLGIDDAVVDKVLGLTQPLQSALYALSIGHADPTTVAPREIKGDRASF
jgi:SagB-type dehydrogenase family enzyme